MGLSSFKPKKKKTQILPHQTMSKLIPFFHKVLIKRIEEKSDEIAKLGSILVAKRIDVPNPKGVVVAVGPAFKGNFSHSRKKNSIIPGIKKLMYFF